jgi:alanine racemase
MIMELEWTLRDISHRIHGEIHGEGQIRINTLSIDSRKVIASDSTLFVALTGEHHNGHDFISDLYALGIRAFMVSRMPDLSDYPGAGFCLVDNTLTGLQQLASARREAYRGTVAAIAGSNGKTIVKEWIYQVMSGPFSIYRSPKSYNSQVGVPLSVWMMQDHHELSVIEAGISLPGEMEKLRKIIAPDIGLFTNIGTAHQENFRSIEEKLQEKISLFSDCRKVIYRSEAGYGGLHPEKFMAGLKAEMITWSLAGDADYRYTAGQKDPLGTEISAQLPAGGCLFKLPFSDDASIENALHAFTFAVEMGNPVDQAIRRIEALEPVSMRLEMLRGINGSVLVNDTYNSDIGGVLAALDLVNQQDQQKEKLVILSDLLQSGMKEKDLYGEIAELMKQKEIERFIGIGPSMMRHRELFPPRSLFYKDTEEFLKRMDTIMFRDKNILIKGSRRFGFERITAELQLKTHQTLLEIDLNAIVLNLNYYRSLLKEGVKIMVMVKALSYGSGSIEIANLLQYHKVDYLAVAFIDEGVELRDSGIHLPIMIMNPDPSGYGQMIDDRLEPEVYNLKGIESLYRILHYRGITQYPVHIKVDSGMHRLGFQEDEIDSLIPFLKRDEFHLASAFTHLAASDDPGHDDFSREQIGLFERATGRLSEAIKKPFDRHVLNTSGIERFPDAQFQMVRLGIGLHGIGKGKQLVPVTSYKTTISQVRVVKKGETIGYSRRGKTGRESLIATIPVGYADGLDRRLGNGVGKVWIKGVLAPTIGNICMDMTMIDVTGLGVMEGEEVELFGKNLPVSEVSRLAGTIPHEILTSIPERVKRVYLQE